MPTENKKITASDELVLTVQSQKQQYKAALPPQIPVDRFVRVAMTAIRVKPSLAEMDRPSVLSALLDAAGQGLLPDNREGTIVPFKGKAKFMPMVAGILKKARNSGEIKSIGAQVVCEKDSYDAFEDENGPHFKFRKALGDRGKVSLTFAYAITKDGGVYFEEISEPEMAKIRAMARAEDSPWKGPFEDEMRKKSALRRLLKHRVPSSTDLDEFIRADDELYTPEPVAPKKAETTSSRLRNAVNTTATPATVKTEEEQELAVQAGEEIPL